MIKLIPNGVYQLNVIQKYKSVSKSIKNIFKKNFRFIKKKDNKLIFSYDEGKTLTLWIWQYENEKKHTECYISFEKNGNYRTTQYPLTPNSILVYIQVTQINNSYRYLELHSSDISTINKFISLIDFYNKPTNPNTKKKIKKVTSVKKVFQDYYVTRYISEFL